MLSKIISFILLCLFVHLSFEDEDVKCLDQNEIFGCGSACQRECTTLNQQCPIANKRCYNGCYCKENYARNINGKCIPIEDCPEYITEDKSKRKSVEPIQCIDPNEEYTCGSACQRQCATLDQPCPIINISCNDGCYCKDGYARNYFGRCIQIIHCPT